MKGWGWLCHSGSLQRKTNNPKAFGCSSQPLSWLSSPQLRLQQPHLWPDLEPPQPPEEPRGLLGRGGSSDGGGRLHPGHGLGHGRQHPPALQLLRPLRPQTHGREAQVGAGAALPALLLVKGESTGWVLGGRREGGSLRVACFAQKLPQEVSWLHFVGNGHVFIVNLAWS